MQTLYSSHRGKEDKETVGREEAIIAMLARGRRSGGGAKTNDSKHTALKKKKIKFSSSIRKSRRERLQSHKYD
jgi:hypothetical protein